LTITIDPGSGTEGRIERAAEARGLSKAAYVLLWIPEASGTLMVPAALSRAQSEKARAGQRKRRETEAARRADDTELGQDPAAGGAEAA